MGSREAERRIEEVEGSAKLEEWGKGGYGEGRRHVST